MPLAREFLQRLAETRLREAWVLCDAGLNAGAYYLAGYAVELGLKACVAKQFKIETIPDWAVTREFKTHRLTDLVRLAGLDAALREARALAPPLDASWIIVANWTAESGYIESIAAETAQLVEAVGDPQHGVL